MVQKTPRALQEIYDRAFFTAQVEGSSRSATVMVPHILGLFPRTASVVDVGCGTGVWLQHFKGAGVPHVLGLDGGGALANDMLLLQHGEFRNANFAQPLRLPDQFDLAISLEVAEHLPPSAARTFVANLCRLSDAVVFGAAIPGQSGTWHVNERWPSYWAALFDAEGYELFDVLRPQAWYDRRVEWWYAQNTLVFVRRGRADLAEGVRAAAQKQQTRPLDFVHPRCFEAFRRSGEARAVEAEARLTAILCSASWRITGPARRLARLFPRLRVSVRSVLAPVWRIARSVSPRQRVRIEPPASAGPSSS